MKESLSIILSLLLAVSSVSQPPEAPQDDSVVVTTANSTASNSVPGLKLPANFEVRFDEGFVTVKAECDGPVEWIVLSTGEKVKYKLNTDKSIDIAVPPTRREDGKPAVITLYCYGLVDEKLTKAARCDITVNHTGDDEGNGGNNQSPLPDNLILTVVEDPAKRNSSYTLITRWPDTVAKLQRAGHKPYLRNVRDRAVQEWLNQAATQSAELKRAIQRAGVPFIVVQEDNGKLLGVIASPKTVDALLKTLNSGG